ncbi:MAG: hypothetical protein M3075_02815 [Candidatus Dormibacteraeota bacterium]|nr:hypothetical protein [Candidatus Dormibacteraeota bacterium]
MARVAGIMAAKRTSELSSAIVSNDLYSSACHPAHHCASSQTRRRA